MITPALNTRRTVRVTSAQWRTVLHDSDVAADLGTLEEAVADLGQVERMSSADVGRRLFGRLYDIIVAYHAVQATLANVGRFVPPDELADDAKSIGTAVGLLLAILDWAATGLDLQHFHSAAELRRQYRQVIARVSFSARSTLKGSNSRSSGR